MADALEVALYIHSASVGTEIIHGKGLNHFGEHFETFLNNISYLIAGSVL